MVIVYISGIDGCGKTTQAQKLVTRLNGSGRSAEYQWLRWEPSVVPLIQKLRRTLSGSKKAGPSGSEQRLRSEDSAHARWKSLKNRLFSSELFRKLWLFYATRDYYKAYRKARINWKADYIVLDRYLFDFIVDQAINFGQDPHSLRRVLEKSSLRNAQTPDFTIIIDLPAELGYERKSDGTALEYLKDREGIYGNVSTADNVLHVDGKLSPDTIHEQIYSWLESRSKRSL